MQSRSLRMQMKEVADVQHNLAFVSAILLAIAKLVLPSVCW